MSILKRFSPLCGLYVALQLAFWPTPSLLFHPTAISRVFMSYVWTAFGAGIDENNVQPKTSLITPNAYGVVLDLGAGYGHTTKYLDPIHVTKYVALEPNLLMHNEIKRAANAAAGTLVDHDSHVSVRVSTRGHARVGADALFGGRAAGDDQIAG